MHGRAWWRSFYWRVGAAFVLFLFAITFAQGALFSYQMRRAARNEPTRALNVVAATIAAGLAASLRADSSLDVRAHLQRHHGYERAVFVQMADGAIYSPHDDALEPGLRDLATAILAGTVPSTDAARGLVGPAVLAPIHVDGQLRGLVIMPPFLPGAAMFEPVRLVSPAALVTLLVGTTLAALLVFRPARRRLAALEQAAERMGTGDWTVQAPEHGDDEITAVARSFNRMGRELAARDEALHRANEVRRQMLADVSHELKTPLTAMLGFADTLRHEGDAVPAERRERYLTTMAREARRLQRLVEDLLDLARHEQAAVTLESRVFSVERLFEHVAIRREPDAEARGVTIAVVVEPEASQVHGDPLRLEQAVDNLVANALRHVPQGGRIELHAAVREGWVELAVIDTGSGIAPEHLPHVFERFYKVDPARTSGAGGSGLGLSIVKTIAERHGGAVAVTSVPGLTTFTIRLPHAATGDPSDPPR